MAEYINLKLVEVVKCKTGAQNAKIVSKISYWTLQSLFDRVVQCEFSIYI